MRKLVPVPAIADYYTPAITYAVRKDPAQRPQAKLKTSAERGKTAGEARMKLSNEGSSVAFFVHLRGLEDGSDEDIAPVFWNDNYVSVLPSKSRWVTVNAGMESRAVQIQIDGSNVRPQVVRIAADRNTSKQ